MIESVSFWVGGEFLLHASCGNLSGRTSGTESSYTPRSDMSFRSTAGESLLHAAVWNLSRRSSGGESLSLVQCWKLSGRSSGVRVGRILFYSCSSLSGLSSGGGDSLSSPTLESISSVGR